MLTLHLTGPFRATLNTGGLPDTLSRRGQAMLAYLATQPGMRAERGLLADLLWADRAEEQARASLRQELAVLRKTLPDGVLEANRQMVWLDPARVTTNRNGQGEFLQGFDLPSEPFEDWLRAERAGQESRPVPPDQPGPNHRPAVAVLPFAELGTAQTDMFADGVVEEITGALSRVNEFDVIARQSAFALRGEALDVPTAAARLGAQYVVEGSVRRVGDRVRVAVQLVNGKDGKTLWSERFDDNLDDLFDLQDRIAALVAGQISPSLRKAEIARAANRAPQNRTAYELYLTAYPPFWDHNREGNLMALKQLDLCLALDPEYGPALALKAWCLAQVVAYMYTEDPDRDRQLALDAIRQASEHVIDHAPSFTAIGAAISLATADLDQANSYIDRALMLDPNNAWAWMRRGWARAYVGAADDGIACLERAESLSPLDPFRFNFLLGKASNYLHWKRGDANDTSKAVALIKEAIRVNPKAKWAYRMLTHAHAYGGNPEGARDCAHELLLAYPHLTICYLKKALPPSTSFTDTLYYDYMRAAGVPEE